MSQSKTQTKKAEELGLDPELDIEKQLALLKRESERIKSDERYSIALFCCYYDNYTLEDAAEMAMGDRNLLTTVRLKEKYSDYLVQLSIAGSSQDKKSYRKMYNNLKKLVDHFEKLV